MLCFLRNHDSVDPPDTLSGLAETEDSTILIVDDEPGYRDSLRRILLSKGYRVEEAVDGVDAINRLEKSTYEVILLDLNMPNANGHRVLEHISESGIETRIAVISGTSSVQEVASVLKKGIHDYLKKPFDPQDLLRTVDVLCRDIRLQRRERKMQADLRESEQLHRFIVNTSPDLVFFLDTESRFVFVNERLTSLFGHNVDAFLNRPFIDLVATADRTAAETFLNKLKNNHQQTLTTEIRLARARTGVRNVSSRSALVPVELRATGIFGNTGDGDDTQGMLLGIYGSARDLSAQKKTEGDLERISRRLGHVMDANPAVIYSRPTNTTSPNFVSANVRDLLGFRPTELTREEAVFDNLVHPEDRETYRDALKQLHSQPLISLEYRLRHKKEGWRWIRDTVKLIRDQSGKPRELAGSWLDNTEAHLLSEQLSYQASHDPLTGLANRLAFEKKLNGMLESAQKDCAEHALCYLDLDQFKVINDTCGHAAGDSLLRQLGKILVSRVRRNDMLARLGGDEFGLLMENCTVADAKRIAQSMCQAINEFRFAWMDRIYQIGVSVGVVPIDRSSDSVEGTLSIADSACYVAKDAGRNRVHVYRHDDAELARRLGEMEWVSCINRAFDEGRFFLAYQPIVRTATPREGSRCHYELLLRLRDKNGRLVMPGEFLPAAERYHLAWRIDHWVVKHALDWLEQNPLHLGELNTCSINLSGHSLGDERLLQSVCSQLRQNADLSGKICFEITETAAIGNINHALHFIRTLKAFGVRFALDDFGSGLSSFAYLKQLPVDFLKIDGTFVKGISTDPVSLAMVRSINEIGQVMGMETIAEFVDNQNTLDTLCEIGVNYAQGHWISRPGDIDELGD